MVFTRKYGRKRYGRKKVYKKRAFVRRRGIRTNKRGAKIHYFTRSFVEEFTITNAGFVVPTTYGITQIDRCSLMPNWSEFQSLFDSFKLKAVSKKWIFSKTSAEIGTTAEVPNLVTYNDYNDSADMLSETEAMQVATYKCSPLNKPRTRYYKPRLTPTQANTWLPTSSGSENHYGLKWAIDTTNSSGGVTYGICRLICKYYFACKSQK